MHWTCLNRPKISRKINNKAVSSLLLLLRNLQHVCHSQQNLYNFLSLKCVLLWIFPPICVCVYATLCLVQCQAPRPLAWLQASQSPVQTKTPVQLLWETAQGYLPVLSFKDCCTLPTKEQLKKQIRCLGAYWLHTEWIRSQTTRLFIPTHISCRDRISTHDGIVCSWFIISQVTAYTSHQVLNLVSPCFSWAKHFFVCVMFCKISLSGIA